MKSKVHGILKITFIMLTLLTISTSCTEDKWYENPDHAIIAFEPFIIEKNMWTWNSNMKRYEYSRRFSGLTDDMYDHGVINASVFLRDGKDLYQSPLPYIRTWNEDGSIYTEVLSFEISDKSKNIIYYIQASDLEKTDVNNFADYEIKVSVIFRNKER